MHSTCTLGVLVVVFAMTHGANASVAATVRLKSRTIDPAVERVDVRAAIAVAAEGPRGGHLLVQLSEPIDEASRARLAAEGVDLLRYVPDDTWVAIVRTGADLSAASLRLFSWVGALEPRDKLSASLAGSTFPTWTVEPDGRIALRIRFHHDVTRAEGSRALAALGAEVDRPLAIFPGVEARIWPERLQALAAIDAVLWVEERLPPAVSDNDGIRAAIAADLLHEAPYELRGAGVKIGIWDAGVVDPNHDDFAGRLTLGEAGSVSSHATHVAGTLTGSGALSVAKGGTPFQWKGVAPEALLFSWNTLGSIINEIQTGMSQHGFRIVNNSWGFPVDGSNCADYGDYKLLAPEFDALVSGATGTPITVVFSAGNERNDGDCPLLDGEYASITPPKAAKNVIVVGATNSNDDTMTAFSSWGPVDDGRLKPDLTAPGCESAGEAYVQSTLPNDNYGGPTWCGTSMATPAVTGSVALLHELYLALNGSGSPMPSYAKALLIATAEDLGNPGPDYAFGHGRVDVARAADELVDASQLVFNVAHGQLSVVPFEVPPSSPPLRVALVWDDPDALPLASPALINNLDLLLRDPVGTIYRPWVLDPASPSSDAARGVDVLNNVEHITVPVPMPGSWTLEIWGANVPEGPQLAALSGMDQRAPGPVTSLAVDGNTATSIDLSWTNPSASDFDGALLVRATSAGAWSGPITGAEYAIEEIVAPGAVVAFLGSEDHTHSPFSDVGLVEGTTYYYDAYAFDQMRNYSLVASTVGVAGGAVDVEIVGGIMPLALGAPRPNPSRSGTVVRFSLPEPMKAALRVYDAGGRHVITLQRGELAAASYEMRWDARDAAGREVSPGVYFVALETPEGRLTQRVTVLQ